MTDITKLFDHRRFFDSDDLFFRNFFDTKSFFLPAINSQANYPVDAYETGNALNIEIAVVGLNKEDINIEECDGILKVSYEKEKEESPEGAQWIQKGIAKRSFSLGWKVSDKYDLKKIEASLDKGILKIEIPKADEKTIIKNRIEIKQPKQLKK